MNEIDEYLIKAFERMIDNEVNLLSVHEIAYAHRLAIYLEEVLIENNYGDYNIDLEYNRDGIDEKKLIYLKDEKVDEYAIRPDIIVHKRNKKENLIAIELKKDDISDNDKNKVEQLCKNENYEYENGYCISINKKQIMKYSKEENRWIKLLGDYDE